jgi:hypothetical protein
MGESSDFVMSEGWDAMSRHRLSHLMRLFGMLEGLPGMFVAGLIFLFPLLLAGVMGVGGEVVQFGRPLMIFVV